MTYTIEPVAAFDEAGQRLKRGVPFFHVHHELAQDLFDILPEVKAVFYRESDPHPVMAIPPDHPGLPPALLSIDNYLAGHIPVRGSGNFRDYSASKHQSAEYRKAGLIPSSQDFLKTAAFVLKRVVDHSISNQKDISVH